MVGYSSGKHITFIITFVAIFLSTSFGHHCNKTTQFRTFGNYDDLNDGAPDVIAASFGSRRDSFNEQGIPRIGFLKRVRLLTNNIILRDLCTGLATIQTNATNYYNL